MADERDLCKLADVRSWLGFKPDNTDSDKDLSRLITACSGTMLRYMQREIVQQKYTHTFNGTGTGVLTLRAGPIVRVSAVSVNGQDVPPSDYYVDGLALYLLNGRRFTRGPMNVQVKYTAGYDTIPVDLAQACIEVVGLRWRERDRIGHASKSLQGETVSFTITDFPPQVRTLMDTYKRVTP